MPNPLFKNSKGQDVNTPVNRVDNVNKTYNQSYNNFNLDRPHATSLSFADITPFEGVDCIGDDIIKFGSSHKLRSYTLSSPLMDDIYMKKSYYALDMRAILPLNWDIIYREPSLGDDIPNDSVNTVFNPFAFISNAIYYVKANFVNHFTLDQKPLDYYMKLVYIIELLLSDSSLFSRFGIHLGSLYKGTVFHNDEFSYKRTIDTLFEQFYSSVVTECLATLDELRIYDRSTNTYIPCSSYAEVFELTRTYPSRFSFGDLSTDDPITFRDKIVQLLKDIESGLSGTENDKPINYNKIVAYQLICSEYFTNDKVDNVYSSEIFHKNMRGLISRIYTNLTGDSLPTFMFNGIPYLYDTCSGYILTDVLDHLSNSFDNDFYEDENLMYDLFGYVFNLFGIRKSLRFGDYFLGSRTTPYAPHVDMTAEVHNGNVSAIDITRSIFAQRFANSVARTGRKFSDYLSKVIGGYDVPDVECPRWLASTTSKVSGFEVENTTSEKQGNIVTVLNTSGSDFIYELEVGSPTIVIGVCTFFMTRFYESGIDRFAYHYNRYDMFNKFMQYEGDQTIKSSELDGYFAGDFSYQIRHSEYKMRYPICSGAWKSFLPSMFMKAGVISEHYDSDTGLHIDSFNIRSLNTELDSFYSSLTFYSLCGRYHFQAIFYNSVDANRRMAVSPQIL